MTDNKTVTITLNVPASMPVAKIHGAVKAIAWGLGGTIHQALDGKFAITVGDAFDVPVVKISPIRHPLQAVLPGGDGQ